jgi:hypothetical protein
VGVRGADGATQDLGQDGGTLVVGEGSRTGRRIRLSVMATLGQAARRDGRDVAGVDVRRP